jgi:hypothetical protein
MCITTFHLIDRHQFPSEYLQKSPKLPIYILTLPSVYVYRLLWYQETEIARQRGLKLSTTSNGNHDLFWGADLAAENCMKGSKDSDKDGGFSLLFLCGLVIDLHRLVIGTHLSSYHTCRSGAWGWYFMFLLWRGTGFLLLSLSGYSGLI